MSDDDLNRLAKALQATPPADPGKKAAHLRAALDNFDSHQERPADTRQTNTVLKGVSAMFDKLTTRTGLALTTGLVTAGAALLIVLPTGNLTQPPQITTQPEARVDDAAERDEMLIEPVVEPEIALDAAPTLAAPAPEAFVGGAAQSLAKSRAATREAPPRILPADPVLRPDTMDTEAFPQAEPNPLKITADEPVSTFSIDVDTASYGIVRQSLMTGALPPKDAVRIEEMVNYFPYDYPAPDADGAPFRPTVSTFETPWNADTQLVHIALQGRLPATTDRPPLNLVFLIDTSGSMNAPNKLPLLKQSLRLMLSELRPEDQVAMVTYAGSAGQVLAPTSASERDTILAALDRLDAGGSTAGQAGLQQAYATAAAMAEEDEVSRVLLATDGDFNVGLSDPDALTDFIADKRDSGTYLSVLGFGRGNLDDATMQALAQNGNGMAAYIDTLAEARKVLVDQLSGALFPIADDVKIQVEFNPATVSEYRLLGYETRALRREDFNNDRVDAGEIGTGHSVTAIYEVTPTGSPAELTDALRYGTASDTPAAFENELGFLRLRYKQPGAAESQLIETPIPAHPTDASDDARFAAAIAGFGRLLRGEKLAGGWTYADAIALAGETRGTDPFGYRAEALTLMRLAESLTVQRP
ncbi:vWA domain-containing protein [Actibacterium ureilyticum]|uniref:vWA domain-containing protein n=1 Tax=Actibacterium ureilyticum TaxID=1590614 RepID=UPI000BAACEC4|nr:VWA domain-containing protein [Actibacterium ureilyticum]